ncbi:MAG: hypothetical protein ACI9IP_001487 [Arcticibacterium sp.]|jgi:hypothetical protein
MLVLELHIDSNDGSFVKAKEANQIAERAYRKGFVVSHTLYYSQLKWVYLCTLLILDKGSIFKATIYLQPYKS